MGSFVCPAWGFGPKVEYLSCASSDYGAQPVAMFTPGLNVTQGSIVIGVGQRMPGTLYTQWIPPNGFWVAMANTTLPNSQPAWGSGTDALHFSLGPSVAQSGD